MTIPTMSKTMIVRICRRHRDSARGRKKGTKRANLDDGGPIFHLSVNSWTSQIDEDDSDVADSDPSCGIHGRPERDEDCCSAQFRGKNEQPVDSVSPSYRQPESWLNHASSECEMSSSNREVRDYGKRESVDFFARNLSLSSLISPKLIIMQ